MILSPILLSPRLHLSLLLVILPIVLHLWFYYDLPLATDEIFYWSMAIFPSLGYYNHAPLVAWLLIPLTWFGDVPAIQIRLMATLFTIATSLVLMLLLLKILAQVNKPKDKLSNLLSNQSLRHPTVYLFAWVLLISPISLIAGTVWTTDAPLFLFMSLCILTFYIAYKTPPNAGIYQSIKAWLPCGIFFGLAMLSKYSAIAWGGSACLYLLYSKQGRKHLLSPGPWIALVVSMAFLIPVILWNLDKGWVAFSFVFQHGFGGGPPNTLLLIGGMAFLLSPVVIYVVARSHWLQFRGIIFSRGVTKQANKSNTAANKSVDDAKGYDLTFLLFITYIPLAFFFVRSFSSETYLNWVGVSCLTLLVLFSIYASQSSIFGKKTILLHSTFQLMIIGTLIYFIAVSHPTIRSRIISYTGLTPHVEELQASYPQAYLYGDSYGVHAILCRLKNEALPYRYSFGYNNHFDYVDKQIPLGADILLFSFSRSGANRYTEFFDEIHPLEPIEIINDGMVQKKIYPFLATNNQLGIN